mmetsp:Transcript_14494/g.26190  ORF Transcript_14494/g.26190 Transcript_14494/m.26190 type:complete len:115 (-) Transcript_14494:67-411(-)
MDGISCVPRLPHNTAHKTVARTTDQGTVKSDRSVRDKLWTVRSAEGTDFCTVGYSKFFADWGQCYGGDAVSLVPPVGGTLSVPYVQATMYVSLMARTSDTECTWMRAIDATGGH